MRIEWNRFAFKWRVRISYLVFTSLLVFNVLVGLRPHGIIGLHDAAGVVGLSLVMAGVLLRTWSAGVLRKREKVVRTGPYALIRHPLYVGSLLSIMGFCFILGRWYNFLVVAALFFFIYIPCIREEERKMGKDFAGEWEEYCCYVPRFLPQPRFPDFKNMFSKEGWSLAIWLKNREYRFTTLSLIALMFLEIMAAYHIEIRLTLH